jgi:hypothetical protein
MEKFLGLPLTCKPLTDTEHVERARKDLRRWRRYGKWLAAFQVAVLVGYIYLLTLIGSTLVKLAGNQVVGGLCLGIMIGMGFGIPILHVLQQFVHTIGMMKGDRTVELLVKYHDALLELARSQTPPIAPVEAGQGRAEGQMMSAD